MSKSNPVAFNARAVARVFKPERLYRVYFAPGGLFFIRVGGARHDQVAMQFGLIGLLISTLTKKKREKKVQEKAADMDTRSLRDRIEDHKDNFREAFTDIVSSTIDPPAFFQGQGGHRGRWKLMMSDRKTINFQFDTIEDVKTALEELPKALGDRQAVNVEWNAKKKKYVKKKR